MQSTKYETKKSFYIPLVTSTFYMHVDCIKQVHLKRLHAKTVIAILDILRIFYTHLNSTIEELDKNHQQAEIIHQHIACVITLLWSSIHHYMLFTSVTQLVRFSNPASHSESRYWKLRITNSFWR